MKSLLHLSGLKGIRPIKSTVEFLLKLHSVVKCYLLSEKDEIKVGSPYFFLR